MTVCKYYLRVFFRNKLQLIIWLGIFAIISFFSLSKLSEKDIKQFEETRTSVAVSDIKNEDNLALLSYLDEIADIKRIDSDEVKAREMVYLGGVDIAFIEHEDSGRLVAYSSPANAGAYILLSKARNFFNFNEIITGTSSREDGAKLAKEVALSKTVPEMFESEKKHNYTNAQWWHKYEFRFMVYPLMIVIMSALGLTGLQFKKDKFVLRQNVSAKSASAFGLEYVFANILSVGIILACIAIMLVLMVGYRADVNYLPYIINVIAISISSVGLIFLLLEINANKDFIMPIATMLPMMFSFISGVFISAELLPKIAVDISRFFPIYYYVKACELAMDGMSLEFFYYVLVELLFGLVFFLVGIAVRVMKMRGKVA